ncbi:CRACD-like protein isoform X2 [Alligator mississippiensis]|uniref:CRACD-like protein isoform X2 n=1 Tax=Alligator mississippiensis TaxID=8496 RepID=UPI0006ECCBEB|nr:CRACD-like protein isoform X2 [Alligator mississippiensis]
MASFYKCIRGDSSDCNMSSTRIMDSKLREAEGFGEDNSGKKKSKFKSFKKFFGKRKRKETLPSMGTSRLKPCQSTSDVMASESAHISYDSEDELENHKGVMGSRALSHDSIFIPEAAQEPCRRVRVFSQENISDRIRTLQLKLQHNLKLGPPPPPSGILVKRVDDAGASSEDDGLPRSPPEMSLIHEVLGSNTTRFSDSHKHLSSLSLAGTGSEEEEQVTSGPSSRPRSTEGQLFPKHESAKTRSPRTSDSSISPAADFDTPPKYSTCLDNSAAKHKLLIKPRNQRSSRMQRFSLTQSESLNDLSCTPEEEEHDGREILTDLTDEILNTSHQDLSGSTAVTCDMPSLQRAEIPADFSYCLRQTDERPSSLQFTAESAIRQKVLLPENNPELCQTAQELTYLASDYPSPLEPKENSITWSGIQNREMQRERKCSETLNISMGNVYEVSNDIMNRENKQLPSVPLINKMLSEGDAPTHQDISSCLEGSKDKGQKDKISVETFCNMEEKRESAVFSGSCKQLPEGPSQHVSQSALSQAGACAAWSPEKKSIQEPAVSNEENNQSLIQRETILERKGEKAATGPIALRKFSVSSAWERPRTSSFHLKESSEYESLLNSRLSLPKPNLLQNEKSKEEVQMGSDLQERKSRNKMRALLPESDCEITGHAMDKMVSGCVSQVADETSMPGDSSLVSQHQSSCEDKNPFQVKLRSTSLSLKYGDSSSTEAKGIKRYSAEFNVDKEGLASFLKGEKAQIKTTTDVNISVSLNANQTPKAKSPEQLNTKPPLPKKPILQNITNSNKEKQENGIKSPESRNEDRDLEKKLSPPQVPEKSVPSLVMTADSGRRIDSESKPAWITIARQKQRGMQQEQELNTEEKLVVQDMKSETEKANQEKERTEGSVKQQTDSIRNKFSDSATTSEEQRKETKSDVKEPLPRASFLSHHVSEISQCKKASHSAPDQPSWMELAKKKSQAWNDMPRIIK